MCRDPSLCKKSEKLNEPLSKRANNQITNNQTIPIQKALLLIETLKLAHFWLYAGERGNLPLFRDVVNAKGI